MAASVITMPQTAEKKRQVRAEKAARRASGLETPEEEAVRLQEAARSKNRRDANPEGVKERMDNCSADLVTAKVRYCLDQQPMTLCADFQAAASHRSG